MVDEMRAVIYVRVSTNKQEADNQLKQLRPFCKRAGYEIVGEYVDVMSGQADNRPAYNQMYKDAHQRKFDILVFWSLDRFSRSGTLFTLQKLQELENLDIEWESYQEQHFRSTGPFRDVLISILATVAKIERDRISERTKAGLERAKAEGKRLGRPPGSKDKKPRRRKGYYDNKNWRGNQKIVSDKKRVFIGGLDEQE
jgi:DNA invertase Pin-like site-specific DNA recombinase